MSLTHIMLQPWCRLKGSQAVAVVAVVPQTLEQLQLGYKCQQRHCPPCILVSLGMCEQTVRATVTQGASTCCAACRYPQLMQALMTRFGGHPYDELDLLPFNVVDPVKRTPLENLWGMGHNRNELVRDTTGQQAVHATAVLASRWLSRHLPPSCSASCHALHAVLLLAMGLLSFFEFTVLL